MEKLILAWKNLSLRGRLILSSVICILLPLIFSFIIMNNLIQEELVDRAVKQSDDSLSVLDIQMTGYFNDFLYLSNYITFDSQIRSVLNRNIERSENGLTTPETEARDHIDITRTLEGVTNLLPPAYLTIVLENGFTYTNYPVNEAASMSWMEVYEQNKENNDYGVNWIGAESNIIYPNSEENPYLISISRIMNLSEKSNALQGISINEQTVRSILDESVFTPEQELLFVDSNGEVVSHTNEAKIGNNFQYEEELLAQDNYYVVENNENDYLMVSRPFTYGSGQLISLIPYSTAIGNIQIVTGNILGLLLLFFLFFLIILILLVRVLTNPLTKLNKVIKEVNKGNLQVRSGITGDGDIERLGDSLDSMLDMIEQMIVEIKLVEKNKRKAELEMLQAQINPHFLFNILNSLRLKILLNGDEVSAKLIQSLSLLLRMTITRNNEFVSLREEIELVEHYLELMNFKSRSNIKLEKNLDQKTLPLKVPRFFLQPLIENSITHGFDHKSGVITIVSKMEENRIRICVSDNGNGFNKENLELLRNDLQTAGSSELVKVNKFSFTGIGIRNVFQRMQLIYEDQFHLSIENQETGGTKITFYIPRG